jgi:hypothetical protein
MRASLNAIAGGTGDLVIEFFVVFSRFECALKRAEFVKADNHHNAFANWDNFAKERLDKLLPSMGNPEFNRAKSYLIDHPPQRQLYKNGRMCWQDNAKRKDESDGKYLLRLVRDVRDNLFHGGKYPMVPIDGEALRNRDLLQACLSVLAACRSIDSRVDIFFNDAS